MRSERPMLSSSSTIRTFYDAIGAVRKHNTKRGAAELAGYGQDVAARKQRALAGDREPQAHAVFFEGDRGLKQRAARLFAQSGTGIVDFNRDFTVQHLRHRKHIA